MFCVVNVLQWRYISIERRCAKLRTLHRRDKSEGPKSLRGEKLICHTRLFTYFPDHLEKRLARISEEIIFLACGNGMAATRSPKRSAKYDDTHGAATRQYSTSGGGMVDVDLRASQPVNQPANQVIRMNPGDLVTDLPQFAGKAGGCRLNSNAPEET